ncbi:MAG: hypothetical protein WC863_01665 [Patescibacteria group bacterium]
MFPEQLKKILNIIKNTNDRVVIYDANTPDESYVVMNFNDYASRLAVKNNPVTPVNLPLAANASSASVQEPIKAESLMNVRQIENLTEEDLTDKINREISVWKNRDDVSYLNDDNKTKKAWAIPPQVRDKAQEVKN